MKKYSYLLVVTVTISLFIFSEISCRVFFSKTLYSYDQELGWATKRNFSYTGRKLDAAGNAYDVSIQTNEFGFRSWGDLDRDKEKIFFIGDSFTGDANMSDEEAFFGQVRTLTGAEVFAYGAGGYGTLQELIILRKYVDMIDPDYVVLQFSGNDFENNSLSLEGRSIVRNQKNLRPYFDGNGIVYRTTSWHWYRVLYTNLALFRFTDIALQKIQFAIYKDYYPPENEGVHKPIERAEAEQITETLLLQMANSVPQKTRLLIFSCGSGENGEDRQWVRMAERAGFTPLPNVSMAVEKAEREGVVVRAADGAHWGPQGHLIAGRVLAEELSRMMTGSKNAKAGQEKDHVEQ